MINDSIKMYGEYKFTIRDAETGRIKRIYKYKNLIPTAGRSIIAEALSGGLSAIDDIEINKTALGSTIKTPKHQKLFFGMANSKQNLL